MSLSSQNLVTNSHSRISFYFTNSYLKNPNFSLSLPTPHFTNSPHFQILKTQSIGPYKFESFRAHRCPPLKAFESDGAVDKQYVPESFNFDAFLSIAEFLCLASSAVISIGFVINSTFSSSQKPILVWLGNRGFVWQFVLLMGGMMIGAAIRRRQWSRICVGFSKPGSGVNLVERIEKLEEDLRSSATLIRVLSRHLEKLGIRFRVTRKAMKDPIAETAAMAQKNSEATRALAVQEDILEQEVGEIQKVLLAMQEQQLKQLELIIAIGKTGKLWDGNRRTSQDLKKGDTSNSALEGINQIATTGQDEQKGKTRNSAVEGVKQMATNQIQAMAREKEANNDSV